MTAVPNTFNEGPDGRSIKLDVELPQTEADQFDAVCTERDLTVSQAVRQGLSLLIACDFEKYHVILRPIDRSEFESEILPPQESLTDGGAQ